MDKALELWDIYDSDKKLTGKTMKRGNFTMKEGEFHLTVLAVLCTDDKKILITKRSISKKWAGGHWEIPGGGVKAGENSYEAIVREVLEETNIDLTSNKGKLLYTYKRENPHEGDNYFVDVYGFHISKEDVLKVKVQEEEVDGFKLATLSEIEAIAEKNEFLHFVSTKEAIYGFIK